MSDQKTLQQLAFGNLMIRSRRRLAQSGREGNSRSLAHKRLAIGSGTNPPIAMQVQERYFDVASTAPMSITSQHQERLYEL